MVKPELNLGVSRVQTRTETQTWEVDTTINIPPRSRVTTSLSVVEVEYDTDFTVEITAPSTNVFIMRLFLFTKNCLHRIVR